MAEPAKDSGAGQKPASQPTLQFTIRYLMVLVVLSAGAFAWFRACFPDSTSLFVEFLPALMLDPLIWMFMLPLIWMATVRLLFPRGPLQKWVLELGWLLPAGIPLSLIISLEYQSLSGQMHLAARVFWTIFALLADLLYLWWVWIGLQRSIPERCPRCDRRSMIRVSADNPEQIGCPRKTRWCWRCKKTFQHYDNRWEEATPADRHPS